MTEHIGIYGGTFDPIHFGHLNLALHLMEFHQLNAVWFCPARLNPYKIDKDCSTIDHRLHMVSLAIEPIPQFKLLDYEARQEGPSYTINTLRYLYANEQKSPDPRQFHLLLGDDILEGISGWKEAEEVLRLAPPLIGCRQWNATWEGVDPINTAIRNGMTPTPIMEISSTEIRQRISRGLYCGYLVPEKVLDYIKSHRLYLKEIY